MRARLLIILIATVILMLCGGCHSINGIDPAVQGLGSDIRELGRNISWLSHQREDKSLGNHLGPAVQDDVPYHSEVGGEKAYYRILEDGQFVRVAIKDL